jgi:hypothetical protein
MEQGLEEGALEEGGGQGRRRGRGKEVGGMQGPGRYIGGQKEGDVREEGTLHRSAAALPSYTTKTSKHTQKHT